MPTIYRTDGFRFVIYPNDHEPAHVHVFHGNGEVKINICVASFPKMLQVFNMSTKLVMRAFEITLDNQEAFLLKWREIHEQD